jgi:hypothetical protein
VAQEIEAKIRSALGLGVPAPVPPEVSEAEEAAIPAGRKRA